MQVLFYKQQEQKTKIEISKWLYADYTTREKEFEYCG